MDRHPPCVIFLNIFLKIREPVAVLLDVTDNDHGITDDASFWAAETCPNAAYPLELLQNVIAVSLCPARSFGKSRSSHRASHEAMAVACGWALSNGVVIHVPGDLDGQSPGHVIIAASQIHRFHADMTTCDPAWD